MTKPQINKTVVEKVKTAIIFGAALLALGFVLGDHYATKSQQINQKALVNAVHTITVKG